MSNQHTIVDVGKSLVPLNAEAISENLTYSDGKVNLVAYSARNVLPTDVGYMSFFGTANSLGDTLLAKDIQEILSFRLLTGDTILLALCRDGCYFKALAGEGAPTLTAVAGPPFDRIKVDLVDDEKASWTFLFSSPQGSTSPWHLWTYALLENKLYLYQKGMKFLARITSVEKGQFFVDKLLPTFIISATAKIYRYVAALTILDRSEHTSRQIVYRSITTKVPTTTSAELAAAHNVLVGKLGSQGLGAYLENFLVTGPSVLYSGLSYAIPEANMSSMAIKPDGTKLYVNHTGSITIPHKVESYALSTAWKIDTAVDSATQGTLLVTSIIFRLTFKPDGTKLYIVTNSSGRPIEQFSLSTPWDITTGASEAVYGAGGLGGNVDMFWHPDGTKLFYFQNGGLGQHNLTTAWDVATASLSPGPIQFLFAEAVDPSMTISSDGLRLVIKETSTNKFHHYTLGTAWDITTLTYVGILFDAAAQVGAGTITSILFGDSNTKLYLGVVNGTGTIYQYRFSSAKYTGNLIFSIMSLDGTDPVVSVSPTSTDEPFTITSATNEVIELAQVEGISASRGRLLAWDYLNSIYIGSATQPEDFTPALSTQANVYKVDAIRGNIVLVLPHPEGVIIYSTGNIVKSIYTAASTQQIFKYIAIEELGSIDPRHITAGVSQHYFIGSKGLHAVDYAANKVTPIAKELVDFLNTYKYPIHIQLVGNRYLVLSLLDKPTGIDMEAVRDGTATAAQAGTAVPGYAVNPTQTLALPDVAFGQNLFPTYQRALVYDTLLEKWGQLTLPYRTLFSINPLNQEGYLGEKDYALRESGYNNDVRSLAGILSAGRTVLFDDEPATSWLVYGKYKLSNSELTKLLEVEASFLDYPNCRLQVEPSLDGRLLVAANVVQSALNNKPFLSYPILRVARWFNVVLTGKFNLIGLTVKGKKSGIKS